MGFSRQGYWSVLPYFPPGDLPDQGMEPGSSPLQVDSLPSEPPVKPNLWTAQGLWIHCHLRYGPKTTYIRNICNLVKNADSGHLSRPTLLLTVKSINLHLWNASQVILMDLKIWEPVLQTSMVWCINVVIASGPDVLVDLALHLTSLCNFEHTINFFGAQCSHLYKKTSLLFILSKLYRSNINVCESSLEFQKNNTHYYY